MSDEQGTHARSILNIIQAWLPVLTVVIGTLWGLYTYIDHQKTVEAEARRQSDRDSNTRRIEAQKPFLQKQLELYFEAARVAGQLVTEKHGTPNWDGIEKRFWALYWSELSMVEHGIVEKAMKVFGDRLIEYKNAPNDEAVRQKLNLAAYELAHAIRAGIENAWGGNQTQNNRL